MRECQPLGELARRFIGGLSVERHHRGRHARQPAELGTPSLADARDLDLVRAPADDFFESMHRHNVLSREGEFRVGVEVPILRR